MKKIMHYLPPLVVVAAALFLPAATLFASEAAATANHAFAVADAAHAAAHHLPRYGPWFPLCCFCS